MLSSTSQVYTWRGRQATEVVSERPAFGLCFGIRQQSTHLPDLACRCYCREEDPRSAQSSCGPCFVQGPHSHTGLSEQYQGLQVMQKLRCCRLRATFPVLNRPKLGSLAPTGMKFGALPEQLGSDIAWCTWTPARIRRGHGIQPGWMMAIQRCNSRT